MYCTNCGALLSDSAEYCNSCGAKIGDMTEKPYGTHSVPTESTGTVEILTLLWGIIGTVSGLSVVGFSFVMDEPIGIYSASMYLLIGSMTILSGIFAAASYIGIRIKHNYNLALYTCVASTVFACTGIIGLVIGIFVCWKITKCRYAIEHGI